MAASAKQFSIDFSKLSTRLSKNLHPILQLQKVYYVRAVPVDVSGNPIGDPGMHKVIYGQSLPAQVKNINATFQLWTPLSPEGSYSGEFTDFPRHDRAVKTIP